MGRKKQETMVLFKEVFELTGSLSDAQFGQLIRAASGHRFGLEATQPEDPVVKMALAFVTAQVDRYEDHCQQHREAARKRCAKKQEEQEEQEETEPEEATEPKEITQEAACTKTHQNGDDAHSTSTSTSASTSTSTSASPSSSASAPLPGPPGAGHTGFIPPTKEQVWEYCRQHRIGVDPGRFVDYYASVGWMIGRSPMRDWKAALRSWKGKEPVNGKTDIQPSWSYGNVL